MSLEDKLNPNNRKDFIDSVDDRILSLHKKIGDVWQKKSYKSKDTLVTYLYGAASFSWMGASGISAQENDYITSSLNFLMSGVHGLLAAAPRLRLSPKTVSESFYSRNKIAKSFDFGCYLLAVSLSSIALSDMCLDFYNGDAPGVAYNCRRALVGFGLFFGTTANYLNLANSGKPPKPPKKRSFKERIKSALHGLLPQPEPKPEPNMGISYHKL